MEVRFDRFSVNGKTLLLQLPIWKTVIFRVDLLCTLDFIVSEYRRNSAIFVLAPENGARFGPGDLVILDEAGMSNLEDLHNFMGLARQRGFGVIFSGDDARVRTRALPIAERLTADLQVGKTEDRQQEQHKPAILDLQLGARKRAAEKCHREQINQQSKEERGMFRWCRHDNIAGVLMLPVRGVFHF